MEDWGRFIWTVAASSAGTSVLLAAVAWLFKGQITHWLNKDLEQAKAKHQRDLETYKVGLIAQAEQAKSLQAVKTAKALRIAELQYAALERLQRVLSPHASRASAFMRVNGGDRDEKFRELNTALADGTDAIRSASLFLTQEEVDGLYRLQHAYSDAIKPHLERAERLTVAEILTLEGPLFDAQREANAILRRHIHQMLDMS